ncbi:MAG: hypothetical protein QM501_03785 [Gimesia sp.]
MKLRVVLRVVLSVTLSLMLNSLAISVQAEENAVSNSLGIELVSVTSEVENLESPKVEEQIFTSQNDVLASYQSATCDGSCQPSCSSCQCCDCNACTLCDRIPLLSKFPSDPAFKHWIMPVSNPVWSIDPRSLTYVRGIFINQMIDSSTPALGAGDLQVYALQLGIAINERLSFIAVKDGYNTLQTRGLGNSRGWADIALGVKYVLIRDVENQFLLSTGLIYETHNGSLRVFQGNGEGVWNPFVTGGKELCNGGHIIANAGFHLPADRVEESTSFWYSVHYDHPLTEKLSAIAELNGIVYTRSGGTLPFSFEGGDWINLGSANVAGNNVVTTAFGADYKMNDCLSLSGVWEFPISNRKDLLDSRTTITMTLTF